MLPKVPDQSAHYSRQLHVHNFTVLQDIHKNQNNKKKYVYVYLIGNRT